MSRRCDVAGRAAIGGHGRRSRPIHARGGQTYGKTDERGIEVVENYVEVPSINATIAQALGLPQRQIVTSQSRRPFTVANKAAPIAAPF